LVAATAVRPWEAILRTGEEPGRRSGLGAARARAIPWGGWGPADHLDDQQRLRQAITGALEISSLALQELFIEDRQAHLEREIIPQIGKKAPTAVISDRYFLSTMAYGMATDISFEELWQLHRKIRWFVFPDLTIIIDVAADIAFERTKEKKSEADIFEKKDTMGKIRAQYTALAKMLRNDNVYMIDGSNSPEAIFAQIEPLLDKLVKAKYH